MPQESYRGQGASPGPVFSHSEGWGHLNLTASSESGDHDCPPAPVNSTLSLAWNKLQPPHPPPLSPSPFPTLGVFLLLALLTATSLRISLHLLKVGISKYSQLLIAQPAPDSPLRAGISALK